MGLFSVQYVSAKLRSSLCESLNMEEDDAGEDCELQPFLSKVDFLFESESCIKARLNLNSCVIYSIWKS